MTKAKKAEVIAELKEQFSQATSFYLADSSTLNVEDINSLRQVCFDKDVVIRVAKNTLIQKALESVSAEGDNSYDQLFGSLKGPTTVIFSEVSNLPAKIIKDFRKTHEKPVLKAAYIDSEVFLGDDQLEMLTTLKSKDELIGDVLLLLQSPAKNLVSALQSAGGNLAGIIKTLAERTEA